MKKRNSKKNPRLSKYRASYTLILLFLLLFKWNIQSSLFASSPSTPNQNLSQKITSDFNKKWTIWTHQFPLETSENFQNRQKQKNIAFQKLASQVFQKYHNEITKTLYFTPQKNTDAPSQKENTLYTLHSPIFTPSTIHSATSQNSQTPLHITPEWQFEDIRIQTKNFKTSPPFTLQSIRIKSPNNTLWTHTDSLPYSPHLYLSNNRKERFQTLKNTTHEENSLQTAILIRCYLDGDGVTKNTKLGLKLAKNTTHPLSKLYAITTTVSNPNHHQHTIPLLNIVTSLKKEYTENPNPELALGIGKAYEQGWGVPKNYTEAKKWYQKDIQDPICKWALSQLYLKNASKPDKKEAFKLILQCAKEGMPKAAYQTWLYDIPSKLSPTTSIKSIQWLIKAAHADQVSAKLDLAAALITGNQIQPNKELALEFLNKAEHHNLKKASYQKMKIIQHLSPKAQTQLIQQLVQWQPECPTASFLLGKWALKHPNHDAIPATDSALFYLNQAAQKKHRDAYEKLADVLVKMNTDHLYDPQIIHWYQKASQTSVTALYKLSQIYEEGNIDNKNLKTALLYRKAAAKKNHPSANFEIAQFYQKHPTLPHSEIKQHHALQLAANHGHIDATLLLAKLAKQKKNSHDYQIFLLEPLAINSVVEAQFQLSEVFANIPRPSLTQRKNQKHWLQKAAMGNHTEAIKKLKQLTSQTQKETLKLEP